MDPYWFSCLRVLLNAAISFETEQISLQPVNFPLSELKVLLKNRLKVPSVLLRLPALSDHLLEVGLQLFLDLS